VPLGVTYERVFLRWLGRAVAFAAYRAADFGAAHFDIHEIHALVYPAVAKHALAAPIAYAR